MVTEEPKEETYSEPVILGLDPAFRKAGFGIIKLENGEYIDSFQMEMRPFERKLTQGQVDGYLSKNAKQVIAELFKKYNIEYTVIEL